MSLLTSVREDPGHGRITSAPTDVGQGFCNFVSSARVSVNGVDRGQAVDASPAGRELNEVLSIVR
jgi:hypothetical protein